MSDDDEEIVVYPLDPDLDSDLSFGDLDLTSVEEDEMAVVDTAKQGPQFPLVFGSMSDLPQEQKNVVRIFLSSTFTDMKVERNMLMSSVYPRLKKYCQETYKLEFQVVDMRWGVQDQASDDHSTSELCTREIYNCQRESAGPNFVCLLGDRYGTRYLKKIITEEHWTILVSRIISSEVKQWLDVWYRLDTNSVIPQRILQPISCIENGEEQWEKSSSIMYSALKDAAVQAKNDGELAAEIAQTFIRSVTEEEIDCAGMLSHTESENKPRCLAFIRRINNINLQHVKAGRFVDINDSKESDAENQALLSKLKEQVKEGMPTDNVKEYSVNWSDDGGINTEEHKEYLHSFGEDFYDQVKRLVDSAVESRDQSAKEVYENEIAREVLAHSKQALNKLSKVVSRLDILDKLKAFITGDSDRPLVVHGHSGCGKTSIMASVAKEAGQWLSAKEDKAETAVILRFLGTTPYSSDIEHLLQSLIAQLRMINADGCQVDCSDLASQSLSELIKEFHKQISESSRRLVIVVDSIDQLRNSDVAFNLSWLPEKLPKNVRFVISTLPDIYGIFKSAQSLDIPKANFVEVKALDEKSAWTIIDKWLEMCGRKVTKGEREAIAAAFKNRSLPPLYIKLIFDILVKWTSYSQTSSIPTDVISCMDLLFTNLESTHGKVQVQLALAYLTCCPGGISETELEDVLSIDDVFLNAVYQYHIPPTRRIPPTLWMRMKNDIRDYLVEKDSNGAAAWFWYHRQFIEYATRRYTNEEGDNTRHCMDTLCEYFTDKWSETPKSFTYTPQQMKKLNLSDPSASSLRYVAPQPTRYGRHRFNTRKISVLSQLWSNGIMKDQVYRNSAAYIMDIEFLTGKFVGDNWSNINTELSSLTEFMDDRQLQPTEGSDEERYRVEFRYIHAVLKMYSGLISTAPLALSAQLFACLQDKYNLSLPIPPSDSCLPNIAWFLTQLTTGNGVDMCPLLPVSKILDSPGEMQRLSSFHEGVTKMFSFTYQGKSALAVFSEEMVVYVLEENGTTSELMSISLPNPPEYGIFQSFGADENYIFGCSYGSICLISLDNKRVEFDCSQVEVEPGNDEIVFRSTFVTIFHNPLASGRDSIMFYAFDNELAVVYSFKQRKVVWYHHIPADEETGATADEIYHMSVHDTEEPDVKSLIIVLQKRTEFSQMQLLADGGVKVTKQKETANGFVETTVDKLTNIPHTGSSNNSFHGLRRTDIVLPELPRNDLLIMSDIKATARGVWSYYEVNRKCDVLLAGKLRNGDDLLALCSAVDPRKETHIIELYTVSSHDSLALSACITAEGDPSFVYLVPESDVLIVAAQKTASVYFLSPQKSQLLDVILAFEFVIASDEVDDFYADSAGFLGITSLMESCSKIWDLTAYTEDSVKTSNPRIVSTSYCMGISHLDAPDSCAIVLQDDETLWDLDTNRNFKLPCDYSDQPMAVLCTTGEGKWKHTILIASTGCIRYVGVNVNHSSNVPLTHSSVVLYGIEGGSCEAACLSRAMMVIDSESGRLDHFVLDKPEKERRKVFKLMTTKGKTGADPPCSWKSVGFSVMEFCFADNVLLVSGDECDPDDDDADSVSCLLLYDTVNYKLIQRILEKDFTYAVYFKAFKLVILTTSDPILRVMDVGKSNSFDLEDISLQYGRFTMLESYGKTEGMDNMSTEPYFYVYCDEQGLLKMDVRVYKDWAKGEGVVCLGKYPTSYNQVRLSHNCQYLVATTYNPPRLQLCQITETKVELLGEILFQGDVDMFAFSKDDKYVTTTLQSGEVIIIKVLDPTKPDLIAEVNKLTCTKNNLCKTKDEYLRDSRYTAMAALSGAQGGGGRRDVNTLHNFVRACVMPKGIREEGKAKRPVIGTTEFLLEMGDQKFSKLFDPVTNNYVPTINTTPFDAETVLQRKQKVDKSTASAPQSESQSSLVSQPVAMSDPVSVSDSVSVSEPVSPSQPVSKPVSQPRAAQQPLPTQPSNQTKDHSLAAKKSPDIKPTTESQPPQPPKAAQQSLPAEQRSETDKSRPTDGNQKKSSTCSIL